MNVGIFNKQEGGALFGNLPTMQLSGVSLEPVAKTGNGPDYRASVEGAELGAAWAKTTKEGRRYLSFKVVIPGREPVHLAIFPTETADQYAAVYSEPRKPATSSGDDANQL